MSKTPVMLKCDEYYHLRRRISVKELNNPSTKHDLCASTHCCHNNTVPFEASPWISTAENWRQVYIQYGGKMADVYLDISSGGELQF